MVETSKVACIAQKNLNAQMEAKYSKLEQVAAEIRTKDRMPGLEGDRIGKSTPLADRFHVTSDALTFRVWHVEAMVSTL